MTQSVWRGDLTFDFVACLLPALSFVIADTECEAFGSSLSFFSFLTKTTEIQGFLYHKCQIILYSERFEPKGHFISKLSMIVRVNVALNRSKL